jgi:hypothetical protein
MSRRWRVAVMAIAALLLIAAATTVAFESTRSSAPRSARELTENGAVSEAFAKHREDLLSAKVGTSGESPVSYADQLYQENAYPSNTITGTQIATAREAWKKHQQQGNHQTDNWTFLGPTGGLYPAFLNRHGSDYMSSGRITALAVKPGCNASDCLLWVAAAGGGVWRTGDGLSANAHWKNVSDGFFTSGAIGSLTYDAAHHTLYAGTGEDAAAGDAEAGVGIFKSTDNGNHWTALGGNANFVNRAIRQIAIDQNDPTGQTIYVADGRGVHGISATTAGAVSQIPNAPGIGVWKSTDGGATFTLLQHSTVVLGPNPGQTFESSFGSTRGATDVAVDPTHAGVIYATAYNKGVWRSTDNGATWTNIHTCQTCGGGASRSEFGLTTTPDGHTRMYQTEGDTCDPSQDPCTDPSFHAGWSGYSRFFVANGVESGSPTFDQKTSTDPANPGWATWNFCTGQCWYDEGVTTAPGNPNIVYVWGSYLYLEDHHQTNARAVLLSQDGGNTFTDLTDAATGSDASHDGLHPDQHALAVNPSNPLQYWEGSDGGLMRSSGTLSDISSRCDSRGLSGSTLARCKQMLSAVPSSYTNMNLGLATLQFQHVSVNPRNANDVQGGTQDNGTFETQGSAGVWPQTIFGDGGLSGFDATDNAFRFHTYFLQQVDVNFNNGAPPNWDWISDPLFVGDGASLFYFPIITDPTVHGTMFAGIKHVWRTKDDGGPQAYLDQHCNEFTGDFAVQCGDWVHIGGLSLTSSDPSRGGSFRAGGNTSWLTRAPSDNSTLWAATSTGRLFISKNADADPASSVVFTRCDTLATNSPGRAISSISVDPANPNHAYVSYLGYSSVTPTTPGHVFSVTCDPVAGTATWTPLEGTGAGALGEQPINGVAYDNQTGDLYAATDFGALKLPAGSSAWEIAGQGLPIVTVAGLNIDVSSRQLFAATHGRGAYKLPLAQPGGGG